MNLGIVRYNLYREAKNLEVTIVESAEAKIDKKEEIKLRQEKKIVDEINKRADLNKDRDLWTALTSDHFLLLWKSSVDP